MEQGKKRIAWLDMAKGYGMIFVILAHLEVGIIGIWIYTFHMPLFFLLSGYVFTEKKDFKTFFKHKCKSMLLPYICLGIPMVLFDSLMQYISGDDNAVSCIILAIGLIIQQRMWTLWFLACLFFLNIFFFAAKRLLKTDSKMAGLAVITTCMGLLYYKAGGPALPWNIDVCLMAYPFFFTGYFYKKKHASIEKYLYNKKTSVLLFIILGILNVGCGYLTYKISGNGMEMFYSTYGFAPFTYASAFAGIACVILMSKWITIKPIRYIGENSLLYFAWHQTIMIPVSEMLLSFLHFSINHTESMMNIVIYKLSQLLIIIVVLTICNYLISNTRLKFMLGKN